MSRSNSIVRHMVAALAILSTPSVAADLMTAEQRRDEVEILKRDYVAKAPSFDIAAKARANALLDAISGDAARISDRQYLLRLAEVTAQADNGHDSLAVWSSPLRPASRLPLRMVWIGERLFVARAAAEYDDLAGAEVLRLGRWTVPELFAQVRRYQGGKDEYRRWHLSWLTHNPEMLEALGAVADPNGVELMVRLGNGRKVAKSLRPVPADSLPLVAFPAGWLSGELTQAERDRNWKAGPASPSPLYLQEPGRYFRSAELPSLDALYVQFRSNFDMDDEKIAPFVAKVDEQLRRAPPANLILDLRLNTGGDNTQNRELMRTIARTVPERIFVIIGPYTYSAGIAAAAALIHDGGAKVTVVGEEPGDRNHWWSEREEVCLPYSKVCANRQMGYWDLIRGCAGKPHCFGDQFDVRIHSLRPSVERKLTADDWIHGRDAAMDWISKALAN